jgi:hypothetical protein
MLYTRYCSPCDGTFVNQILYVLPQKIHTFNRVYAIFLYAFNMHKI